jgi:hypothetical protein
MEQKPMIQPALFEGRKSQPIVSNDSPQNSSPEDDDYDDDEFEVVWMDSDDSDVLTSLLLRTIPMTLMRRLMFMMRSRTVFLSAPVTVLSLKLINGLKNLLKFISPRWRRQRRWRWLESPQPLLPETGNARRNKCICVQR